MEFAIFIFKYIAEQRTISPQTQCENLLLGLSNFNKRHHSVAVSTERGTKVNTLTELCSMVAVEPSSSLWERSATQECGYGERANLRA